MDKPSLITASLSQPIGSPHKERKAVTVHGKLRVYQHGIAGIEIERGPLNGTWEVFDLALELGSRADAMQAGQVAVSLTIAWDE